MSDLISIIMPVKDAQQWLEECLASIQAQSIQNWELIAVDDHSSDNSLNILKMASEKDERIHVSINNGTGIIDALEAALSLTNGSWISRMDADDLMPPNKLELLFAALDSNEKAVSTGKVKYFGEEEITQGYQEY